MLGAAQNQQRRGKSTRNRNSHSDIEMDRNRRDITRDARLPCILTSISRITLYIGVSCCYPMSL